MTAIQYTRKAARGAAKLVKLLKEYPPGERVDWRRATEMCLTNLAQQELNGQFGPWLCTHFGVTDGLVHWTASKTVTAAEVCSKLQLFSGVISTLVDAATIMRDAARLISVHGWIQDSPGSVATGFDLVGSIAAVCETRAISQNLRLVVIESLRDYLASAAGGPFSLTEWNDALGRTKQDVLHLLSACADDTLTI